MLCCFLTIVRKRKKNLKDLKKLLSGLETAFESTDESPVEETSRKDRTVVYKVEKEEVSPETKEESEPESDTLDASEEEPVEEDPIEEDIETQDELPAERERRLREEKEQEEELKRIDEETKKQVLDKIQQARFDGLSNRRGGRKRSDIGFKHASKLDLKKDTGKKVTESDRASIRDLQVDEQKKIIQQRLKKLTSRHSSIRIRTQADLVLDVLDELKEANTTEVANRLNIDIEKMENWCKVFEKNKLMRIKYPVNPLEVPRLFAAEAQIDPAHILHFYLDNDFKKDPNKVLLNEYEINADLLPIKIRLWHVPLLYSKVYEIDYPDIGLGTFAILDSLKSELATKLQISGQDVSDHEKLIALKDRYLAEAYDIVDFTFPYVDDVTKKLLSVILVHITYGLGIIEVFLHDDDLEEIVVNTSKFPVTTYHKDFYWIQSNAYLADESVIYNYSSQMGRKAGRQITSLDPLMDAHMPTGERVNATISPVSSVGHTITLRKQSSRALSPLHFVGPDPKYKITNFEIQSLLWLCMQNEMNVMVVGGTASGKTSMLNALLTYLPTNQHVVTIEDTRELTLPNFMAWNWIPLTTKAPTPEGKGEVTMLDLLVNSLRMRPDRIILGEVRRASEAQTMFEAMHTGHAAYATFHANTADAAFRRLTEAPINIPELEIAALHVFLIQSRNRRTGYRRSIEVVEVFPTKSGVMLQTLYKWNSITDKFVKKTESKRIYSDVTASTGMTSREIDADLQGKQEILKWLQKHKVMEVTDVGMIINQYYRDQDDNTQIILDMAHQNKDPKIIIEAFQV